MEKSKNIVRGFIGIAAAFTLCWGLASCGNSGNSSANLNTSLSDSQTQSGSENETGVNGITITGTGVTSGALNVYIGNKDITLKAVVSPSDATGYTVIWNSSSEDVATISQTGVLHFVSVGSSIITAAVGKIKASVNLTVKDKVLITSMAFKQSSYDVALSASTTTTLDLADELVILPDNATSKTVVYSIAPEDSNVIINAQGMVSVGTSATPGGEYTVTAASVGQSDMKAQTLVKLTSSLPTGMYVRLSSNAGAKRDSYVYEFSLSDKQFENLTFAAELRPVGAIGTINYSSKNPSIADINQKGVIDIKAVGETQLVFTTAGAGNITIEKDINIKITDPVNYPISDLNVLNSELPTSIDNANYWDMETNPSVKAGSAFYCVQEPTDTLGMYSDNIDNTGLRGKLMPNQGNGAYLEDGGWCVVYTTWDWPYDNEQANAYLFDRIKSPAGATTLRLQARSQSGLHTSGMAKFRVRLVDASDTSKQVFLNINGMNQEGFTPIPDRSLNDNGTFDPDTGWIKISSVGDYNIGEDIYFLPIPEAWRQKDCYIFVENDDIHVPNAAGTDTETGKCDVFLFIRMGFVDNSNDMSIYSNVGK
ncbi:MAG: Ig-like domain-containing protein [Bacilli bacterium]|nr:Ig-like domain-containing protein [Bacilli bacterium]